MEESEKEKLLRNKIKQQGPIYYDFKNPSPLLKKVKELYPRSVFKLCPNCENIFMDQKSGKKIYCSRKCLTEFSSVFLSFSRTRKDTEEDIDFYFPEDFIIEPRENRS